MSCRVTYCHAGKFMFIACENFTHTFNDGTHIIFSNGKYNKDDDNSDLAKSGLPADDRLFKMLCLVMKDIAQNRS